MSKSNMDLMDAMFDKIEAENRDAEAKARPMTQVQLVTTANMLAAWSKGKPIIRAQSGATFWRCGSRMTQLTYKDVEALVKMGRATVAGDPKNAGAVLRVTKA